MHTLRALRLPRPGHVGLLGVLALALAGACAAPRTVAATQPGSPSAFDVAGSDAKAIAIADQVLEASGGAAAWAAIKELRWTTSIYDGAEVKLKVEHIWDRWNGRANMKNLPQIANASVTVAMYELYTDTASALVIADDGRRQRANAGTTKEIVGVARKRWAEDHFWATMHLKLKDPGVHLAFVEERAPEDAVTNDVMQYDVIKVTFDPGVGASPGDVYYFVIDKTTHLPDSIEMVPAGKGDDHRIGYKWTEWVEAGGVKFAMTRQNIGLASEKITFTAFKAMAKPDDDMYSPPVGLD